MKNTKYASISTNKMPDLTSMMQELQADILSWIWAGLFIIGFILILMAANFRESSHVILIGLLAYGLALIIYRLRKDHYLISAWILIVGLILIILLIYSWMGIGEILYLLGILVGMTMLLINPVAGILAALALMLMFFSSIGLVTISGTMRIIAILNIWSNAGLVWMVVIPLERMLERAWISYQECQQSLEKARDYQVDLRQTLEDLGDANLQLTRLNRLVHNFYQVAEDARKAKEQFVANVSHELRTPLNMILGFGEMILKSPSTYGKKIPPALLSDLTVIVRNSQHLSRLIDDVLDLSQIEAGQMPITREQVLLKQIVESAVIVVQPLFTVKNLFLQMEFPQEAMVFCDLTRIREVLINLLSNAGRFTEEGGVWLRVVNDGINFIFSVEDTGPGMSVEDQKRLFQPFQQLDNSIRRRYGGTGLGLVISKQFIELHNGKIWIKSEKGSGATFYFSLPINPHLLIEQRATRWINPNLPQEHRSRPSMAPVPVVRPRYIIVEEGNTVGRLLTRHIDQVEVEQVSSFTEAIQALSRMPAQGLIMNSENAVDYLQDPNNENLVPNGTPVIACYIPQFSEQTSRLNISGYLIKPISREKLLATLMSFRPPIKKVLVVDDEPDAIRLFQRMLISTENDYQVLTATNGRQVLPMMQAEKPDLVLLDLSLPEMDGIQILAARNLDPELNKIPIVIISARDPVDQPLSSHSLFVTQGGGLSVPQLLTCIETLTGLLGATGLLTNPGFLEGQPD